MKKKYIALKGRPSWHNEEYVVYFLNTYTVTIWKKGLAYHILDILEYVSVIEQGQLLKMIFVNQVLHRNVRKLKYKMSAKEILDTMEKDGLIYRVEADTAKEACCKIMDSSAYIPTVRDATDDLKVVKGSPTYFEALLNPDKQTKLEREILQWITRRDALLRKHSFSVQNCLEVAEKFANNIATLRASKAFKARTEDELYEALTGLFLKHCIVLSDRIPRFPTRKEEKDTDLKEYLIFA